MFLKKVEGSNLQEVLRARTYKTSQNMDLLEEFMHSDLEVAEVDFEPERFKTPESAVNSLASTAKRMHIGCKVFSRRGHVYLMKVKV